MNEPTRGASPDLPIFEPDAEATYTLELITELTGVSSEMILRYQEHGLVSPIATRGSGPHQFDTEALRTLRRLEHLRTRCEMNLAGLKLMLSLIEELERLRSEVRSR